MLVGTRRLELTGPDLPVLRVEGTPLFDLTVRRWTTEALDHAARDHAARDGELRPDGRVWLNTDHGQQGLGSASCGPALPDRYRLAVRQYRWSLRFSVRTA